MKIIQMNTRRSFIKTTSAGLAGITLGIRSSASVFSSLKEKKRPIHAFTKCLQFLSYDEIGEVLARLGFDGADLIVRPGGQVLPERVKTDLPSALKALRRHGVASEMITTAINDPENPHTVPILET